MKKSLVALITLAAAAGVYGQGTVTFSDHFTSSSAIGGEFEVHIYGGSSTNVGNGATDLPGGNTSYAGFTLLGSGGTDTGMAAYDNGTQWTVGLYAAAGNGVTAATLLSAGGGTGDLVATASFFNSVAGAGLFNGPGAVTINNLSTPGYNATLMLAAWYSGGGATSAAAAMAAGVPVGWDSPVSMDNYLGGNTSAGAPAQTPDLGYNGAGLQAFAVSGVPEPSTIALGVMGASAFLMRLRRKQ
jgi:hypothetical protein